MHINYREALSLKYLVLIDDSLPVIEREQTAYPLLPGEVCSPSVCPVFCRSLGKVRWPSVEVLVPAGPPRACRVLRRAGVLVPMCLV